MLPKHAFSEPRQPYARSRENEPTTLGNGEPSVITYSRGLPSYGNPNQFPNPPQHYFPSIPASQRQRRLRSPEPPALPPTLESPTLQQQQESSPHLAKHRKSEQFDWDGASASGPSHGEKMDWDNQDDADMEDGEDDGRRDSRDDSGPAKKRSRTLTTAHQTAVLNALLSKTRFPSTETREEVGQQIGMSARRVQIWFQNRRQSQKRARDRDVNESPSNAHGPMSPNAHHHLHQQDYLGSDPYASSRYSSHSGRPMSSASLPPNATYPPLSRHPSSESVNSVASFSSAQTSLSTNRNDRRMSSSSHFPYPPPAQSHFANGGLRTYAFPPPPAHSRVLAERDSARRFSSPEPDFKLPPLSSVLGSPVAGAPPASSLSTGTPAPFSNRHSSYVGNEQLMQQQRYQQLLNHQQLQQHASNARYENDPQSPQPRFEGAEFSRLRISNPTSLHPTDSPSPEGQSPPDVLDEAMETVYRSSRANPPRSSLPPLRSSFSDLRMQPLPQRATAGSEADAALLAPILKKPSFGNGFAAGGKTGSMRLPPISSLSLETPTSSITSSSSSTTSSTNTIQPHNGSPPTQFQQLSYPSSGSSQTHQSAYNPPRSYSHASSTSGRSSLSSVAGGVPRSSISSNDTTWTNGGGLLGGGPRSSRTSFSSEVQEEWDRASAALGGGMSFGSRKASSAVREGSWDDESNNGQGPGGRLVRTPEEDSEVTSVDA